MSEDFTGVPYATIMGRFIAVQQDSAQTDLPDTVGLGGLRITVTPSHRKIEVPTNGIASGIPARPTTYTLREWVLTTNNDGYLVNPQDSPQSIDGVRIVASDAFPQATIDWTVTVNAPDVGVPTYSKRFLAPSGSTIDITTVASVPPSPSPLADYLQAVSDARSARDQASLHASQAISARDDAQAARDTAVSSATSASASASTAATHATTATDAAGDAVDARDAINQLQITASASTLDAGESATAVMSGTTPAMTLELGIPRGPKGDPGAKGDPGDPGAPLATYTYTGNTEITVTSVDAGTGVFTKAGHGLVTGDTVFPRANSTTTELPFMVFPGGFVDGQYATYHVTRLDADTFVLRKISTDANPMTFTSSGDPSKWHLEKGNTSAVSITGLPTLTRARLVITGGTSALNFLRVAPTDQNGWGVNSPVWLASTGGPVAATGYVEVRYPINMRVEAILDGAGDTPFISANGWAWSGNTSDATKAVLIRVDLAYKRIAALADPSFTEVYVASASRRLANGFKVEVFAV